MKAFNHSLEKNVLFTHCRASTELGSCLLEKNELSRALHYLQHAKDVFDSGNFLRHYTVHLFYHLSDAMPCSLEEEKQKGNASDKDNMREIKKIIFRSLWVSKRWRTHLPGALRSAAHFYEIQQKFAKAEKLYLESVKTAQKIKRRYEEALSLVKLSSMLLRIEKEKKH